MTWSEGRSAVASGDLSAKHTYLLLTILVRTRSTSRSIYEYIFGDAASCTLPLIPGPTWLVSGMWRHELENTTVLCYSFHWVYRYAINLAIDPQDSELKERNTCISTTAVG